MAALCPPKQFPDTVLRNCSRVIAMSKKTLNKANLERLGAPKLADLVMELVQGSAALQRRARMELSAAQGPKEVTADLRKRFASMRLSRSYVDWRKQRALKPPCSLVLRARRP